MPCKWLKGSLNVYMVFREKLGTVDFWS